MSIKGRPVGGVSTPPVQEISDGFWSVNGGCRHVLARFTTCFGPACAVTVPQQIEALALLGWCLHPASTTSRAACFKGAQAAATPDLDQLDRWAAAFPGCNWRVVLGPSRIWSLDLDVPSPGGHTHDGVRAMAELVKVHGGLPPRPSLRSGGGGLALVFSNIHGERIVGDSGVPAQGIDPHRGRQTQTVPPSIHLRTRKPYHWIVPPWELNPPPAPSWLLRLVAAPPDAPAAVQRDYTGQSDFARRKLNNATMHIAQAGDGTRNHTLNRHAFVLGKMVRDGAISEAEVTDRLTSAAIAAGLDRIEIRDTIRSGLRSGSKR